MNSISRRKFLTASGAGLIGVTLGGVSLRTLAAENLKLADPLAVAMKYVHDSEVEGANCANCTHIKGKDGDDWRPCNIFPGKLVSKNGWCAAWMKKA